MDPHDWDVLECMKMTHQNALIDTPSIKHMIEIMAFTFFASRPSVLKLNEFLDGSLFRTSFGSILSAISSRGIN